MKLKYFCLIAALALLAGCSRSIAEETPRQPFEREPLGCVSGEPVAHHRMDGFDQTVYRVGDLRFGSTFSYNGMTYYLGESMSSDMRLARAPLLFREAPVYTWVEVQGAACGRTRFMALYEDAPLLLSSLDGMAEYRDFDGDGQAEIVLSSAGSLPGQVSVVFWDGGEYGGIRTVPVAPALDACGARYENGAFYVLMAADSTGEIRYTFDGTAFSKSP